MTNQGEAGFLASYDPSEYPRVAVTVDIVLLTVRAGQLSVLLVQRQRYPYRGRWAVPGGFVEPDDDLDGAARRELREETGIVVAAVGEGLGYIEQLRSYGAPGRDPWMRVVSVAYVGFTADNESAVAGSDAADARFWAVRDLAIAGIGSDDGVPLAFDHAAIITDGVERARAKLEYTTLATAFLDEPFTLGELRRVYEAMWGEPLHEGNFRRKVLSTDGFVEPTGRTAPTDGRPAALYRRGRGDALAPADPAAMKPERAGVYPGSFDPLTVAHIAIAEAALRTASLDRIDLVISRSALGKEERAHSSVDARLDAIGRAARARPWLHGVDTQAQLIADIARGYDAVIMGADKWAQVRDPAWYGGDAAARDAAVAALPRVLVVPRPGFDGEGAESLDIDPALAHVSSTRARAGEHHLRAPGTRRRLIVDGSNVIGSRPDGWWRDLDGAARRLIAELQEYASRTGDGVAVVLDGRPLHGLPEGVHDGVLVAYARRAGRDAADDRIAGEVARDRDPASLTVVTSDRALAARARELGAMVDGATSLREGERR